MIMNYRTALLIPFFLSLLSGCGQKNDTKTSEQSQSQNVSSTSNVAEVLSVTTRGEKVPNFSWKDNTNRTIDFDSFRGKVTLINFWATWCGPCKRELPDLVSLSKELEGRNIKILGIATDRTPNALELVSSFVQEQGIPYQNILSNDELEDAFGNPRAIPTSFLIDANGAIAQTFVGMRSKDFFRQALLSASQ